MIEKPKLIDPENHIYSASAIVTAVFKKTDANNRECVEFERMPHDSSVFKLKKPVNDISCAVASTDRQELKRRTSRCVTSLL